ncbi:MAG: GNAT family N-acetyltransferase, partial [Sphingobacteriaceae bacterium]|nr:GNAT family N-acetyltransferase [Cytophagaceae bacterium]
MAIQKQVYLADLPRALEVWESSVRATHDFLTEADIQFVKPLVREAVLHEITLACVRDAQGTLSGFVGVSDGKVEMLFVDAASRGTGIGRELLR